MKRKIWFAGLLLLTITVCYNSYSKEKVENALFLENVEALAGGESHVPVNCMGSGTVDCPITHVKVKVVATGYSLEDLY